jgi:hypothetical protein
MPRTAWSVVRRTTRVSPSSRSIELDDQRGLEHRDPDALVHVRVRVRVGAAEGDPPLDRDGPVDGRGGDRELVDGCASSLMRQRTST